MSDIFATQLEIIFLHLSHAFLATICDELSLPNPEMCYPEVSEERVEIIIRSGKNSALGEDKISPLSISLLP